MKKQTALLLLTFLAIFLFFLSACQKDDNLPVVKTKTQLITQSSWKFSGVTVGGSDASAALQTCQKDNVMVFVTAGTGTVDEGVTKCNSSDPQSNSFTWSLQTNETILFISTTLFTGGSSNFTLVTLNDTQLIVSQMITIGSTPQTAVVTFVH